MGVRTEKKSDDRFLGNLSQVSGERSAVLLGDYGLHLDEFEKQVSNWFEQAIVGLYRERMDDALKKANADKTNMALRLKLHESLRWKWIKEKVEPSWEKLFLAFAAFDVDLVKIGLPRGREAVIHGMRYAVTSIRQQRLLSEDEAAAACPVLDREELEYVHLCSTRFEWQAAQYGRTPTVLKKAANDLGQEVRKHLREGGTWDHRQIAAAAKRWSEAWLLFQGAIPYDWQF